MITRKTVLFLGFSQLICWGISYYLIAAFGELISADMNWSGLQVYGGFSAALVVMALTSPLTGRLIDAYGGRTVMTAGSLFMAVGCCGLGVAQSLATYYAAWLVLGVAMRLTLYDAAFAALARIGGAAAKRPISQITLLGGLASTIFWPIGFFLADSLGWRAALFCYAFFAIVTVPLHLAIPSSKFAENQDGTPSRSAAEVPLAGKGRDRLIAGIIYASIFTILNFLNSGMSAHMINILSGLGLATAVSVWASTLRGIGQSIARVGEVLFGGRIHPFVLAIAASSVLPFGFLLGLASGKIVLTAFLFAFLFGAGNGLMTIARGSLPLVLFEHRTYGSFVGKLLVPSFLLSAASPIAYTWIIDQWGESASLWFSAFLAFAVFALSLYLKKRFSAA